jgi:hypothetical protein
VGFEVITDQNHLFGGIFVQEAFYVMLSVGHGALFADRNGAFSSLWFRACGQLGFGGL